MFFVVSSGRCGSRTIAETFGQFENCVCLHHPQPELVIEATEYFYGTRPRDEIIKVLRATRFPSVNGKVYGEANLQLSLLIAVLNELYPGSQFIWLIRDGRDAVASMYYRGWYDPSAPRIPERWQRGRLQGDRTGDFSSSEWAALDRFGRCCWIWKKYNLVIESELAAVERSRWMKVRLDRLKASLEELSGFLGLQRPRRVLVERHNVAFQRVVTWESWTVREREQFEKHCGAEMDRWFPEWRAADGAWHSIEAEIPDRPGPLLVAKRWLSSCWKRLRRRLGRIKSYLKS